MIIECKFDQGNGTKKLRLTKLPEEGRLACDYSARCGIRLESEGEYSGRQCLIYFHDLSDDRFALFSRWEQTAKEVGYSFGNIVCLGVIVNSSHRKSQWH